MSWLWILALVILGLGLMFLVASLVMWRKMPSMSEPLPDEDASYCVKIVRAGRGYPFVCGWAVRHKACPCLPCKKLDEAKAGNTRHPHHSEPA